VIFKAGGYWIRLEISGGSNERHGDIYIYTEKEICVCACVNTEVGRDVWEYTYIDTLWVYLYVCVCVFYTYRNTCVCMCVGHKAHLFTFNALVY